MKKGLNVVLLAYQEADNLRVLIPQIKYELNQIGNLYENFQYEIMIIDSVVPLDDTEIVCNEYGCTYINQEEPYFGGAFRTAIKYASLDKFLIMDADGSHNPIFIKDIYKKFMEENCDIVIGSRYVKGGRTNDNKSSIIMSHILNFVFRLCLGISAKDISTDYRMYRTKQLKGIILQSNNYDILQEVLIKIQLNNKKVKIKEVPIEFNKRLYGESKRRLLPFIFDYLKSLFKLISIRFPFVRNLGLYVLIGLAGAIIEYGVFSSFIHRNIFKNPEIANIMGAIFGFIFTFIFNTYFNFKKTDKLFKRFLSYIVICCMGMGVSTFIIYLLKNWTNIYVLKIIVLLFVSCIQFFLNKIITYHI